MEWKSKRKLNEGLQTSSVSELNTFKSQNPKSTNESALILIGDRLLLPPYRSKGELMDTELQLDIRPRKYFVSGLCYVCSKPCGVPELQCEGCRMVSYCSEKHRQDSIEAHAAICSLLSAFKASHASCHLEAADYRRLRVEHVQVAEKVLGRALELCEREILLYPRLCFTCHALEGLERCPDCLVVYHCPGKHADGHQKHCTQFRVLGRILEMEQNSGFIAPELPLFSISRLPTDFDRLVKQIFQLNYKMIDCASYAALSQTATTPLTTLYVIENLPYCIPHTKQKCLKIHIIGAEMQFECTNLALWEKLFLHLLPNLEGLKLELYGPELQVPGNMVTVLGKPTLCSECCKSRKTLKIVFHCGKLYHQVENEKPDIVCLFNPGLYRTTGYSNQDTWLRTIQKVCKYQVPIIVTSYTEMELPLELERMSKLEMVDILLEPQQNPFASLRPERNFINDDIEPFIFKNYFVGVVKGTSR